MWARWRQIYLNKRAQALLELAIFGSFLIMLLAILINYGLRYNFQQKIMQETFRKALYYAAHSTDSGTPTSVSVVTIRDNHIPNPSDRFAFGSVLPASSSASVIRSWKLQETADTVEELPRIAIDIKGSKCPGSYLSPVGSDPPCYYLTAGFREESNIPYISGEMGVLDAYTEIYGDTLEGCTGFGTDGECISWEKITSDSVIKTCTKYGDPDPNSGDIPCEESSIDRMRFIDSQAGEIMDYGSAVKQCRQIIDRDVFISECERGKLAGSDKDCAGTADLLPYMQVPWYCQDCTLVDASTQRYNFPILNQLFEKTAGRKTMGIQPDYTKKTILSNELIKEAQTASGASGLAMKTTDTWNKTAGEKTPPAWQDETIRKIVYRPYGDNSGHTEVQEVSSGLPWKEKKTTWQTNW